MYTVGAMKRSVVGSTENAVEAETKSEEEQDKQVKIQEENFQKGQPVNS